MLRYALFQIPGATLVGLLLVAGVRWWEWPPAWAAAGMGAWLLKDAILYRAVAPAYDSDAESSPDPLVGARGVATEPLDPSGYVRVGSELWRAVAHGHGTAIPRGAAVRVRERRSLTLVVEAEG